LVPTREVKAGVTEPEEDGPEECEPEAVVEALAVSLLEPAGALVDAHVADVATVMPYATQRSEANLMVSIIRDRQHRTRRAVLIGGY